MIALLTFLLNVVVIGGLLLFLTARGAKVRAAGARWFRSSAPWLIPSLATLVLAIFVGGSVGPEGFVSALVLGALALLAASWFREFRCLMWMTDDSFPGRNDKLVWAILMIVLPPVGVLAFWSFRRAYWPAPSEKPIVPELQRELG
jgi:hypothetical protein